MFGVKGALKTLFDGLECCSISGETPSSPDVFLVSSEPAGQPCGEHTHYRRSDCLMKEEPKEQQDGNEEIMKNNENWQQGGKTIGRGGEKKK